jgi:hypothetical protein
MNCYEHPEVSAVGTCANCGRGICQQCMTVVDAKIYCRACAAAGATFQQANQTNGLSIASLVLGIVSVPLDFCYGAGLLLAIPAVIMGFVARNQIKQTGGKQRGSGMALAGILTGGIPAILAIVGLLVIGVLLLLGPVIGNVFTQINATLNAP